MITSPCCNKLPTPDHAKDRVVLYYCDKQGWVPIKYCTLGKAVVLQRQAASSGQEMFVFPVEATPARLPNLSKPIVHQRPELL
jgi:hypothetical protein